MLTPGHVVAAMRQQSTSFFDLNVGRWLQGGIGDDTRHGTYACSRSKMARVAGDWLSV